MTASLTLIHHRLSHKHIRRRRVAIFSSLQSFQSLCASVQTHLLPIPVQARPRLLLPSLARIRFSLSFSLFLSHAYIHVHAHTHTHTHAYIPLLSLGFSGNSNSNSELASSPARRYSFHLHAPPTVACGYAYPCLYASAYLSYRAREPESSSYYDVT